MGDPQSPPSASPCQLLLSPQPLGRLSFVHGATIHPAPPGQSVTQPYQIHRHLPACALQYGGHRSHVAISITKSVIKWKTQLLSHVHILSSAQEPHEAGGTTWGGADGAPSPLQRALLDRNVPGRSPTVSSVALPLNPGVAAGGSDCLPQPRPGPTSQPPRHCVLNPGLACSPARVSPQHAPGAPGSEHPDFQPLYSLQALSSGPHSASPPPARLHSLLGGPPPFLCSPTALLLGAPGATFGASLPSGCEPCPTRVERFRGCGWRADHKGRTGCRDRWGTPSPPWLGLSAC